MNIFNATPHEINIFTENQCEFNSAIRKLIRKAGETPKLSIPPSGSLLSVNFELQDTDIFLSGVRIKKQVVSSATLPEDVFPQFNARKDFVIVSALYADGLRRLGYNGEFQLLCVSGIVYDSPEKPTPVGCTDIILK